MCGRGFAPARSRNSQARENQFIFYFSLVIFHLSFGHVIGDQFQNDK